MFFSQRFHSDSHRSNRFFCCLSEIDILVSSMAHFNITASDHMKKLKNVPSIGNASRFENDFDLAGSEASEGDNTEKSGQARCGTARSRDRFHEI